ncbi:MAG: MucR family transcriptional regulator [Hyphomicrobiales bacterium]|nr:MucR family transcriptional regulator [Hyphomicrobiales bacterium]MCY4048725.1 MucR family transcriptional regulator [Hyphomicrobiales bacterium]MCY4053368.1 MucR family transcriptional regulator [Hyphomicrobiales bacterium]
MKNKNKDILKMTSEIVTAYLAKHTVTVKNLPGLIEETHDTLLRLEQKTASMTTLQQPAVPIEESVTSNYIICLEDGLKFKSLRRHLYAKYNMSPEHYRAKWGLPPDYPMVAKNYATTRSRLAKQIGLGQKKSDS